MPLTRGQQALVFSETGAPQSVSVAWVAPYDNSPDNKARQRRNFIEGIGFDILNLRLAQVAQQPDAPFMAAGASRGNVSRSAKIASLRVSYAADKWQTAFEEADKIRRQVLAQGITQGELDRQITAAVTREEAAVAAASTQASRGIANGLVGSIDRDVVYTSDATDLALVKEFVNELTVDQVNAALRGAFVGNGPLLFLSSTKPVEGGEATLASVFQRAESAPIGTSAPQELAVWPYTNFGPAGKVAETRHVDDFDATFIRFENGVRLTVKPTKYRADQILVTVNIAGGDLAYPKDRTVINTNVFIAGGLEAMSYLDLRRTLTGKITSVGFGVDDDAFTLSGSTRPADLDIEMQLLTAYMTKPGWRPEPYQQGLSSLTDNLPKLDSTPMSLFGAKLPELLHPGDARWAYPTLADVQSAKLEQVKAIMTPALANAPIEITMVGDVTVDQAVKSVASTFGALPARNGAAMPQPKAGDVIFPRAHGPAGRAPSCGPGGSGRGGDRMADDRRLRRFRVGRAARDHRHPAFPPDGGIAHQGWRYLFAFCDGKRIAHFSRLRLHRGLCGDSAGKVTTFLRHGEEGDRRSARSSRQRGRVRTRPQAGTGRPGKGRGNQWLLGRRSRRCANGRASA
jgi:zinc protease